MQDLAHIPETLDLFDVKEKTGKGKWQFEDLMSFNFNSVFREVHSIYLLIFSRSRLSASMHSKMITQNTFKGGVDWKFQSFYATAALKTH